ncbi:nephrocystin-1-like isoform X2 [Antedon mediterranea]|uniref:nephrocystin-1-like isoform X2 n=1 Tax=Antedon mediterranea TaxID=105859 RepID=UPI003AF98479
MSKKSPLQQVQHEGDVLKRDVDKLVKECQQFIDDTTESNSKDKKLKTLIKKCQDYEKKINSLLKKAQKLDRVNEPSSTSKFEENKQQEIKRLETFKVQLERISSKLEPDEIEEEYLRKMKQENAPTNTKEKDDKSSKRKGADVQIKTSDIKKGKIDEEVDEDSYDEDEEDDEEYEDEYEEEASDEELTEEGDEEEYEEESEEEELEEGDEEEESEFEEELGGKPDEIEEDDDETTFEREEMDLFEAVCDYRAEQEGDLSFKVGDVLTIIKTREDGWWTAEDEEGNRGLVPSTYLKLKKDPGDHRDIQSPEDEQEPQLSRSGKVLWRGLKKAVRETSATDVLSAMGAIPSGFRPSTTAKLLREDEYTLQYCLTPKLSKSNLFFKDLFWDPATNEIRARNVKMQKIVVLTMIRNIPTVGVGLEVKSRHVRICLFDGEKVLSNIHTIQATWTEVDEKSWRFSPKVTGVLPSILDGECFIRTNKTDENLGLLIEVCLSYVRTKTGEKGEFSCGWVNLPLFEPTTGAPILNKAYELDVKGGTPYEQDVDVDPSISRKASTSKLRSMLSANKQPRLSLKLVTPTKEQKTFMDCLQDTIVSSSSYLPFLSFYRKCLADALLCDRINMQNTDQIHSPILTAFPKATHYSDIMDAFRSAWAEKKRSLKKIDKRDAGQIKSLMSGIFMDVVYPLLHSTTLPPYKWADIDTENERWEAIAEFMKANRESNVLASHLLSPHTMHKPFDMSELTYDLCSLYTQKR